ncbi:hypothetical protein HPB50_010382 [Hyalomma asiaticum]|uniref:Uncharacterized protein n=1 Tax=Hyalomma asiaticum TaxID=266040 RepID=A0ACB7S7W4_HYAAI|nr:hypothetical protein HPB50_010382 [Hyalomma asiaticum]
MGRRRAGVKGILTDSRVMEEIWCFAESAQLNGHGLTAVSVWPGGSVINSCSVRQSIDGILNANQLAHARGRGYTFEAEPLDSASLAGSTTGGESPSARRNGPDV